MPGRICRLAIRSAHIATYGERAVDVFYLTDLTGGKIEDEARLKALEKNLLDLATSHTPAMLAAE